MKKLLLALLFLPVLAWGQTTNTYYTVPNVLALKALTTRPSVVQIVGSNPGIFNWSTTPCSSPDDIFQVSPTSGAGGCYVRAATPYSAGKSATTSGIMVTDGTGVPSFSTSLPSGVDLSGGTGLPLSTGVTGVLAGDKGGTGAANTDKSITLGGNLTTSGAFDTTLTVPGTHNYTFPNLDTDLAAQSGSIAENNIAIANSGGQLVDSNFQLVTSLPAGNLVCNPTSSSGLPVLCGTLPMPVGTAALPTFTSYVDPTSGIYFPSVGRTGISSGTNPVAVFVGNSSTNSFLFSASSTPTIDAVGTLGLQLRYPVAGAGVTVISSGSNQVASRFSDCGSTSTCYNYLWLRNAGNGSDPSITAVVGTGGSDTNVGFNFVPAGSGTLKVGGTAVLLNGGALGTPSSGTATNLTGLPLSTGIIGFGTGVATALGVNVGTAGAPVINGGAGGTPSSITLTNGSGLPAGTGLIGQVPLANGGTNATTGQAAMSNLSGVYVECTTGTDANTTSTTEVALGFCNIPAGVPGANGRVIVEAYYDNFSSTQTSTMIARIAAGTGSGTAGNSAFSTSLVANNALMATLIVMNTGSASAQTMPATPTPYAASSSAPATASINTANAWVVRINGRIPTGNGTTDTLHLRSLVARIVQTAGN